MRWLENNNQEFVVKLDVVVEQFLTNFSSSEALAFIESQLDLESHTCKGTS